MPIGSKRPGNGGARVGAGRKPGQVNKATIEREMLAARIQAEVAGHKQAGNNKLAREALDDLLQLALGLTAYHQPVLRNQATPLDREPDDAKFMAFFNLAKDCAKELAPFQSPKYKSVQLSIEVPPGGNQAPAAPGEQRVMSAQDSYRALRDGDIIELTANKAIAPAAPAAKKRASG